MLILGLLVSLLFTSSDVLLFVGSSRTGVSDLYLFDIHTRHLINLTETTDLIVIDADWSPDGSQIVLSACTEISIGPSVENCQLYLLKPGGGLEQLTFHENPDWSRGASYPHWSPDGRYIAYALSIHNDTNLNVIDLHERIPRQMNEIWQNFFHENHSAWWGSRLAFHDGFQLKLVDLASGDVQSFSLPLDVRAGLYPSPDGSKLAFSSYPESGKRLQLFVFDPARGEVRQLTQDIRSLGGVMWQDNHLIFTGKIESKAPIKTYRVDLQGNIEVFDETALNLSTVWSPDRTRYVYVVYLGSGIGNSWQTDLFLVDGKGAKPDQLLHFDGSIHGMEWRPG
jgi:Tol biopolymer transport system component